MTKLSLARAILLNFPLNSHSHFFPRTFLFLQLLPFADIWINPTLFPVTCKRQSIFPKSNYAFFLQTFFLSRASDAASHWSYIIYRASPAEKSSSCQPHPLQNKLPPTVSPLNATNLFLFKSSRTVREVKINSQRENWDSRFEFPSWSFTPESERIFRFEFFLPVLFFCCGNAVLSGTVKITFYWVLPKTIPKYLQYFLKCHSKIPSVGFSSYNRSSPPRELRLSPRRLVENLARENSSTIVLW